MFDILFGWRKASKCKKLIKQVQCRLKLLKSKRHSIVRQLREDVAHLVKIGYEDIAFNRAEHLFKDEATVSLYELLDNFCEFIIAHLSYIRRHKDCPNDVNEAISSLIFASARCGDLPELRAIRKLFGERYGQRFEITALELLPGNLVNLQVKEKLSIKSVADDVKQKLVDEIARDYCLRPEILALEYTSELQEQVKEQDGIVAPPSDNHHQNEMISTCISSSIVEQYSSDIREVPMNSFAGLYCLSEFGRANMQAPDGGNAEQKTTASSSESLPQFSEEMIVYLDEIEEVQHSIAKEGSSQDQSIFKFKSSSLAKHKKGEDRCMDPYESWSDCSSSSSTRKRVKATKKRTRKRSLSRENLSVKDIHCVTYYEKPYRRSTTPGSCLHNKHHRRNLVQNSEQPFHAENRQKQPQSCQCFNPEAENCFLPCYICTGDGRANQEELTHGQKQKHGRNDIRCYECSRITRESETKMEWCTFHPRPRRRSCDFGDIAHDSFTKTDYKHDKQSKTMKGLDSPGSHAASNDSPTRKATKPPYLRAMTMPQEQPKDSSIDHVLHYSRSFPVQSTNHVHPKLPDCDVIAAKFMALKKEHLQSRCHLKNSLI